MEWLGDIVCPPASCVNNLNTVVPFEIFATRIFVSPTISSPVPLIALRRGIRDNNFLPPTGEMFPISGLGSSVFSLEFGVGGGGTLAFRNNNATIAGTLRVFRVY